MPGLKTSFGRDSILGTLGVATALCVVCSVLVAGAAVGLKDIQQRNARLERQRNVLVAAGLLESSADVREALQSELGIKAKPSMTNQEIVDMSNKRVRAWVVDFDTGNAFPASADDEAQHAMPRPDSLSDLNENSLDQKTGANADRGADATVLPPEVDLAGLSRREKYGVVYNVLDEGGQNVIARVFPVRGKGLWSTMHGFVGIRQNDENPNDLRIIGLKFYEHGETPGLGGEIDNNIWRRKWIGKQIYDLDQEITGEDYHGFVVGARTSKTATNAKPFAVDSIAGATITSQGVTNTFAFWFGPYGFGRYLWQEVGVTDPKALEATESAPVAGDADIDRADVENAPAADADGSRLQSETPAPASGDRDGRPTGPASPNPTGDAPTGSAS